MCENFTPKEYESEEHSLFTFKSEKTNNFSIFLDGLCVHSCKTFPTHQKMLSRLIEKYKNYYDISVKRVTEYLF